MVVGRRAPGGDRCTVRSSHRSLPLKYRLTLSHAAGRRMSVLAATVAVTVVALPALAGLPADAQRSTSAPASPDTTSVTVGAHPGKASTDQRFPGHRPGRIYLGMSCGDQCKQKRSPARTWHRAEALVQEVGQLARRREGHPGGPAQHRLPWISIEGPHSGAPTGWRDVGNGTYDRDIRALARVLKRNDDGPIFLSFDHEMSNNGPTPKASGGRTASTTSTTCSRARTHSSTSRCRRSRPSGCSRTSNHAETPAHWLPPGVLRRASFIAVDLYENDKAKAYGQRLPRSRAGSPAMGTHR